MRASIVGRLKPAPNVRADNPVLKKVNPDECPVLAQTPGLTGTLYIQPKFETDMGGRVCPPWQIRPTLVNPTPQIFIPICFPDQILVTPLHSVKKKDAPKMLLSKSFWSTEFFSHLPRMWSHDKNLRTLRTFVKVNNSFFSYFFSILLFIRAHLSLSSEEYFRRFTNISSIWSSGNENKILNEIVEKNPCSDRHPLSYTKSIQNKQTNAGYVWGTPWQFWLQNKA